MTPDGPVSFDVAFAGVAGQGVLHTAHVLAEAALREGWEVRQGEVHGLGRRGGRVEATVRMGASPVWSDMIPLGGARLIVGLEAVEALRSLSLLGLEGTVVTSTTAVRDISGYPDDEDVRVALHRLPRAVLVEAEPLARAAGSAKAIGTVVLGAATPLLPVSPSTIEDVIGDLFAELGEKTVRANLRAFAAGREAAGSGVSDGTPDGAGGARATGKDPRP